MDDEFDGDLDQYGLPKEKDDEDVLSDDLDLNYEPSQKSKRMQTQRLAAKKSAAKKLPTKLDKANPADSQMDVASSQGSMPSQPGTSKKTKVNPKRDDDDDNKKKKVAALVNESPCLWSKQDKKYRNTPAREAAWEKIAKDVDISGWLHHLNNKYT